jgi:tRNA dimethylallyltransferase
LPFLIAIVGPTASGKSALALDLAEEHGGEIVSCDSTAVYRGFDIGTDKVMPHERRGIPHHLVDVVDPAEEYSAARYAIEAAAAIRAITARGRVPILAGGTGFYYRALVRGLFPGPGRDDRFRDRLRRIGARRGVAFLHRMVARLDPASARRIQPRDEKRLIRALEVYFLSGRPLTDHFVETRSPIAGYEVVTIALAPPRTEIACRVAMRVDAQFDRGLLDEVRGQLSGGVPSTAVPMSGLVYRQALEHLAGVRDEPATRALIVQENLRYARRQLIWFRKEPNLTWFSGTGDRPEIREAVRAFLASRLSLDPSPLSRR